MIQPVESPTEIGAHKRGDILMARKMYREAIETYQDGIKEAAVMYNKIGIAYHHLNQYDKALENYNMSLRLNPSYSEAINNIGTVYYAKKNPKRAIKEYERALKIAPNSASIYSNLGTALFARKKYDDAFEAWQQAFQLDPEVFERKSGYGTLLQERSVEERAKFHFYLAKTYAKAGIADRALLYIRKALEEGFSDKDKIRSDPDFKPLVGTEEFETPAGDGAEGPVRASAPDFFPAPEVVDRNPQQDDYEPGPRVPGLVEQQDDLDEGRRGNVDGRRYRIPERTIGAWSVGAFVAQDVNAGYGLNVEEQNGEHDVVQQFAVRAAQGEQTRPGALNHQRDDRGVMLRVDVTDLPEKQSGREPSRSRSARRPRSSR